MKKIVNKICLTLVALPLALAVLTGCKKEAPLSNNQAKEVKMYLPGEWEVTRKETRGADAVNWTVDSQNNNGLIEVSSTLWNNVPYTVNGSEGNVYINLNNNTSDVFRVEFKSPDGNRLELYKVDSQGFQTRIFLHRL